MPQFADCYFLVHSRSSGIVHTFLNSFIPDRKESASGYSISCEENADMIFASCEAFMQYLERTPNEANSIYWANTSEEKTIYHAFVTYTNDGKMILGISVPGQYPEDKEVVTVFRSVKQFLHCDTACITIEEVAPDNSVEFLDFCQNRYVPI